jgi:hypothetical protein
MEIFTRLIKGITGNGTGSIIITPTRGKRLHGLQTQLTYAGGTNTLAALMTALTEIRVKVGTVSKWRLTGTQLRDFVLLRGTTYDFNGLPNTGAQVTIPLAPEWFIDNVSDALAWNPALLGGDITIEIDSSASLTVVAYERVSDDLNAPSAGIITLEVIKPVAGGTSFYTDTEFEPRGRLLQASIYPDSGGSQEITPASLLVGPDNAFAHEALTSAQNDECLERFTLTPAASGRTANIYDMVFVKADALSRAVDLARFGKSKFKIALLRLCSLGSNPSKNVPQIGTLRRKINRRSFQPKTHD